MNSSKELSLNNVDGIEALRKGGKRALSEALAKAEHSFDDPDVVALLDEAYSSPIAQVIGLTGPPGVGKSTLINGLIKTFRRKEKTVGVIAIDPSSQVTGGALLGDRTRMLTDPDDQGVFIRSLAARGQLGGLSELTFPAIVLMRAVFDIVIVETVGVGQSEAEISSQADSVILCVQPGSGDSLQFMKSGIMEIPDIVVVTKGDMGGVAERSKTELMGALSLQLQNKDSWEVQILGVSALKEEGLNELIGVIGDHFLWLNESGTLKTQRKNQTDQWLKSIIKREYGTKGLNLVTDKLDIDQKSPFKMQHVVTNGLITSFKGCN